MWQRAGNFVYLLQKNAQGVCNAYTIQVSASRPFTAGDADAVAQQICDLLNGAASQRAALDALTVENAQLREQIQQTAIPVLDGGFTMPADDVTETDEAESSTISSTSARASLLELD